MCRDSTCWSAQPAPSAIRQASMLSEPWTPCAKGSTGLPGLPAGMRHALSEIQCAQTGLRHRCVSCVQGDIEARLTVALPARGRTILGTWAAQILAKSLPRCVQSQDQPLLQDTVRTSTPLSACHQTSRSMACHMCATLSGCDGCTWMQVRGSRSAVQHPGWGSAQKACGLCRGHTLAAL